MADRFEHSTYLVRKKIFKILGEAFHIYGPAGELVLLEDEGVQAQGGYPPVHR